MGKTLENLVLHAFKEAWPRTKTYPRLINTFTEVLDEHISALLLQARLDEARGYHLSNPQFDEYGIVYINNGIERTQDNRISELTKQLEELK